MSGRIGGLMDRLRSRSRAMSAADPAVRAIREASSDAQKSRLPQMAAALSYRTIFGLLPVAAVGLVVLRWFVSEDMLRRAITRGLEIAGLQSIHLDAGTVGNDIVGPMPASQLDTFIAGLLERVNAVNFSAIGAVGGIMLLYAAVSMIIEVERCFNQVFQVPRGRSLARRFSNYTTLLVWGPLCLAASIFLQIRMHAWLESGSTLGASQTSIVVTQVLGHVAKLVIAVGMLLVLYTVIPNTKVKLLPALTGSVLGGLLFEASKEGFGRYVEFSAQASYARLYGSLGLIPLFVLWVYIVWSIVLFGLLVTFQLQHGLKRTRPQPIGDQMPAMVDPASLVVLMGAMARGLATGTPQTVAMLVTATGLNESAVGLMVSKLAERGLLVRLAGESRSEPGLHTDPVERYMLGRAAGSIRIAELLEIGFELSGGPEGSPALGRMRRAQIEAADDDTLASIVGTSNEGSVRDVFASTTGAAVPAGGDSRRTGGLPASAPGESGVRTGAAGGMGPKPTTL